MSETAIYVLVFTGLFFTFCALAIVCSELKSRKASNAKKKFKYDERQIQAQGDACRFAFFTTVFYLLAWFLLEGNDIVLWDADFGAMLGLILSATVFAAICILQDAYVMVGASRVATIVVVNLTFAGAAIRGIIDILEGTIIENGVAYARTSGLAFAAACIVLNICFIIRRSMEQKGLDTSVE